MGEIKFNIVGDASGFKKAVADAKAGVSDAKRQIESEGQAMSEVFNKIGKTIGAVFTATMAKELVTNIAKVRGEFQQLEVSFRTMLGSADKANALMAQITQTAAITPFGLQDVANGAKQLLAYGMASEKVNETLIRLGDISAGLSIPLNDLVYLYGTTMTQGQLFTQDFRQFQGRGIPIAEELAKQFGVVKAEVGALVTAGRVGFPEVEKAIVSMTSEGGKFAGLMEAQSKTITGQISNLEDSIDSMFNEIGRANEGVIGGAIEMASTLVENYKEIGEYLMYLVVTYGAYKAATMAVVAVQKIHASAMGAMALEAKLASMAGVQLTASQLRMATATKAVSLAMNKLKAIFMSNPWGIAIAGATALGIAIYKIVTYETEMEKSQRRVNEAVADMEASVATEVASVDALFSVLKNATEGTKQWQYAKDQIIKNYGQYLDGLIDEKNNLIDIEKAYQRVTLAAEDAARARAIDTATATSGDVYQDVYDKQTKAILGQLKTIGDKELEGTLFELIKTDIAQTGVMRDETLRELAKTLGVQLKSTKYGLEAISGKNKDVFGAIRLAVTEIRKAKTNFTNEINDVQLRLGTAENQYLSFTTEQLKTRQASIQSALDEADAVGETSDIVVVENGKIVKSYENRADALLELAKISEALQTSQSGKKTDTSGKTSLANAKSAMDTAHKVWQDAIKANESLEKIQGLQADYDAKKKKYEEMLTTMGHDPKAQTAQAKAEEKALKEEEKRGEELLDLTRKTEDDRLAIKKESRAKEIEAINNAYKRELEDFNKIEAEWKKAQGGKLTDDQTTALQDARAVAFDKAQYERNEVNDKYWKAEEEAMTEYLIAYGTYQQKREAIADKYNKQIAEAETEGQKKILQKQMENELSELDISANKTTSIVAQLFGDMTDKSLADLRRLQTEGKKALDFLTGGQWNEETGKDLGITKEMFNTISADPAKLAELQKILKDLTDDVKALENPFKQVKMGFGDMFKNLKDPKKFSEALSDVVSAMNKISQAGSFVSDSIRSLGNAFGSDTFKGIADGMDMALGALDSAMQGAQAGAAFGPWGAVAGAAIGLVSSLGESIAQLHDDKKEKKIVAFQEQIDGLQKRYDKLGDAIERAYSADASGLIEEQNKMLAKQRELISQQIAEEQDKKNADQSRINEWTDKMEEVSKQIEENKREAIEAMTGTDISSAIDSFATALADAWQNGTDSAYESINVVKKLLRTGIVEYIKKTISPDVEALMGNMANYLGDGVISEYEQALLEAEAKAIANKSDQLFSTAKKAGLLTDEASSGTSGGVSAMSQETAEELNGRFTAMQISMEAMRTSTQVMQGALGGLIAQITPAIAVTTESSRTLGEIRDLAIQRNDYLADIAKYTKGNLAEVTSMAKEIVKIKDKL